eukprot:TRINITY_DN8946_c1_g1_i8.p1 TRINITY_DN8946_c1_g1~~TRINITY_DN8946_c1_g1_i8.p1  ORF type:complete len:123 (-),score=24.67 TRINITY_DN8946_c1_g1_i8:13-381(-)
MSEIYRVYRQPVTASLKMQPSIMGIEKTGKKNLTSMSVSYGNRGTRIWRCNQRKYRTGRQTTDHVSNVGGQCTGHSGHSGGKAHAHVADDGGEELRRHQVHRAEGRTDPQFAHHHQQHSHPL